MKKKNSKFDKIKIKNIILILAIFAAVLFVFSSNKLRTAIVITSFILINRLITTYKMFIRIPLEFEFLTLGIVLTTLNFKLPAGLVIAIFGAIVSFVIGFEISAYSFPMFLGYGSVAIMTHILRNLNNLTLIGIIASIVNNLVVFTLYHYVFAYSPSKNLSFSISNIIFNIVIFVNIAPFISSLI